jgi:hypothetical protein
MPFKNEYNEHINDLLDEQKERLLKHLNNQDLNVHAEMGELKDNQDLMKRKSGGSGFRAGPNEMTGGYEKEYGLERQVGGASASLAQVKRAHEAESVRGAGQEEIYGTQHPFKHPYKNGDDTLNGAGFWDDFQDGFMSVINPVLSVAERVAPLALKVAGMGKKRGRKPKGAGVGMGKEEGEGVGMGKKRGNTLNGDGFWDDFQDGFMSVVNPVLSVAERVAPLALKVAGMGKKRGRKPKGAGVGMGVGMGKKRGRKPKGAGVGMGKDEKMEGEGLFDFNPFSGVENLVKRALPTIKKIAKNKSSIENIISDIAGAGVGMGKKRGRKPKGAGVGMGKEELKAGVRVEKEIKGGSLLYPSQLPGSSMSGMGKPVLLSDILKPKKGGAKFEPSNKKGIEDMAKAEPKNIKDLKMSGGKKKATEWTTLLKKVMGEKKINMKEAIKHIKDNGLYKK